MKESPLTGLKVLELGTLVAAPFATRLLAEFGAEVIKVEAPKTGDPIRNWRIVENGTSLWWYAQARNKKSISLDLRTEEGQEIVKKLAEHVDIIIENFRPGTLEKWNIGYEQLKAINPRLIVVRISGFGQTGPYRNKTGFGSVGESMGGIRYLTGYPDRPPTRVGISLGDSLAGMYAAMAALMAVYHRDVKGTNAGQVVDVALYEAVFSLMESMVPEYDYKGVVRERTGSALPGIAPSNTYLCKDGKYVVIGGNGDAIFTRLMNVIGKSELANDERFASNSLRAQNADFLDQIIEEWTKQHSIQEAVRILDDAGVPAGPIYSVEDMMTDPQFLAREMIQSYSIEGVGNLKLPGIVPKFSETPGQIKWVGPTLGAHNEEVYRGIGLSEASIQDLKDKGVI